MQEGIQLNLRWYRFPREGSQRHPPRRSGGDIAKSPTWAAGAGHAHDSTYLIPLRTQFKISEMDIKKARLRSELLKCFNLNLSR